MSLQIPGKANESFSTSWLNGHLPLVRHSLFPLIVWSVQANPQSQISAGGSLNFFTSMSLFEKEKLSIPIRRVLLVLSPGRQ